MQRIESVHFAIPFTRDGVLCWTLTFYAADANQIGVALSWQDKDRAAYTTTVSRAEAMKMINTLTTADVAKRKGRKA